MAGTSDDERERLLAEVRFGDADHRRVFDIGMGDECLLDLGGIDVHAARDDHVLDAVGDEEEPVFVDVADIAGAVEAVAKHVVAERVAAEVAAQHDGRVDRDLAGLPGRQAVPVLVDDRDLDTVIRDATAAGLRELVLGWHVADHA